MADGREVPGEAGTGRPAGSNPGSNAARCARTGSALAEATGDTPVVEEELEEALVTWLQTLPHGAVVEWTNHSGSPVPDVHPGWVDVVVPAACDALEVNWLFTVVAPDDECADVNVVVEPDLTLWYVFGPGDLDEFVVVVAAGTEPKPDQMARLEAAAAADELRSVVASHAWSSGSLTAALADWVSEHAGRSDLRFEYRDIETPLQQQLRAALDDERFDFARGIQIGESALESILALGPDDAAELSGAIVEALGPLGEKLRERSQDA